MLNTIPHAKLHGLARLAPPAHSLPTFAAKVALMCALAIPTVGLGQEHHHYKLIDIRTLGGPNSSVGFEPSPLNALSSQGVFTACADTSVLDPNYPNFNPFILPGSYGLPLADPVIFHAFLWKNGTLTDLGALPGVNSSCSTHISGNGLIAGASENGTIDPITGWPEIQAVLWEHGYLINLGTLGGNESFSNAINNRGQVVGAAANTTPDQFSVFGFGTQTRAFLWQNGRMRDLGTLGGPDAFAIDINDRGQVLGVSYTNSTPEPTTGVPTFDGFLWENGKMTDIPDPLGGTQLSPLYLSNKGQVVGDANLPGDNFEKARHPFLWENGVFTDLGTFGGTVGDAIKVNDADQIVGDAGFADATYHATIWQNGMKSDLGTVGGDPCSAGFDINSRGQAVGWSGVCEGPGLDKGFLWEKDGPMVDLNTLISSDSGIYVFFTTNINDRGEIAGSGLLPNGDIHAVLLIPCDENHPDIEGCDYSLVDAKAATAAQATTEPSDDKLSVAAGQARQALAAAHESNPVRQLLLRRLGFGRFTGSLFQVPSDAARTTGPDATLSPGSLSFSTQAVSTTSEADTVALKNSGTTSLSISSIAITGTDRADFAQTHTCGSSLAAGASCRINVTFRPTASGTRTATLSVTDDAAGSPQKVSLIGTGTTAQLSPASLNFGTVTIGVNTPAHTVTLTNVGTTTLTLSGIAITGSNAGDFAQTHTCGSSLAVRANCSISVTFKPTVAGTRMAMLSVTDNTTGSPQKVNLAGIGTTAKPDATLSAASLIFGTQLVGTTSPAQSITLTNNSAVALFIGSISSTTHFAETNNCLPTLASGSSCTISVTFTPTGSGAVSGTLSISDDAARSPQRVSLSGTGSTMTPLLNGYCFATCRGRVLSPVACPVGQEAKTPDFAPVYPCGPVGAGVPVDVARSCLFPAADRIWTL